MWFSRNDSPKDNIVSRRHTLRDNATLYWFVWKIQDREYVGYSWTSILETLTRRWPLSIEHRTCLRCLPITHLFYFDMIVLLSCIFEFFSQNEILVSIRRNFIAHAYFLFQSVYRLIIILNCKLIPKCHRSNENKHILFEEGKYVEENQ